MIFKNKNIMISKLLIAAYVFMFTFSAFHNHDTCLYFCNLDKIAGEKSEGQSHSISNKDCTLLQINSSSISYAISSNSVISILAYNSTINLSSDKTSFQNIPSIYLRGPPIIL